MRQLEDAESNKVQLVEKEQHRKELEERKKSLEKEYRLQVMHRSGSSQEYSPAAKQAQQQAQQQQQQQHVSI